MGINLSLILTIEEKKVFSELWTLADNIKYGLGSSKKERKDISEKLHELHDQILLIIKERLENEKFWSGVEI